jgi:hypothetical protein
MSSFEELVKRADQRILHLQRAVALLSKHWSDTLTRQNKFGLSVSILHSLLEEVCLLIAFEVHKDANCSSNSLCRCCGKQCFIAIERNGLDIYGNKNDFDSGQSFSCCNCGRLVAPSRFAPHLEKCMGMGRNSRKRGMPVRIEAATLNDDDDSSDGKRRKKLKRSRKKKEEDGEDDVFSENEDYLGGSISNFVSFPDSDFVEIE